MLRKFLTSCCVLYSGCTQRYCYSFTVMNCSKGTKDEIIGDKGKGKGAYTLDIAPLRSESPQQKRLGFCGDS